MNLHIGDRSFWLRVGRLGISVMPASEQAIDCFNVARAKLFGTKVAVLWLG